MTIDIDKLEALRAKAERGFGMELHEAYKNELFVAAPALFAELRRLRSVEAAARAYCDLTPERADETPPPLLFARLQAALAAKGDGK